MAALRKENMTIDRSCRGLFLSAMGSVYFCAFVSIYLQYPGLLGEDGLLPATAHWNRLEGHASAMPAPVPALDLEMWLGWWTKGLAGGLVTLPTVKLPMLAKSVIMRYLQIPCLLWFMTDGADSLHVDQAVEGLCLLGIILSVVATVGVHHVSVFFAMYALYLSILIVGQRWLSFQWDIFLLESGAMTLLYCPWLQARASGPVPPAAWLLRVLITKFMFMNGVVKITANCPTWNHLTALEYHFASTCLPTSEAWFLHQLPPVVLRAGVAAMFVVELVAPWFLVCPIRPVRQFGVALQVPLQLGIMVTGNYNWFNYHVLVLLLPAWGDDEEVSDDRCGRRLWHRICCFAPSLWNRLWKSWLGCGLAVLASIWFLAAATANLFEIHRIGGAAMAMPLTAPSGFLHEHFMMDTWVVRRRFNMHDLHPFMEAVFSREVIGALFVLVCMSGLDYCCAPLARKSGMLGTIYTIPVVLRRLVTVLLVMPALALCILPCESIYSGARQAVPFHWAVKDLEHALHPWNVATGYGLFRRMTGVGSTPLGAQGWGGLPPTVVQVPAVVLEGSLDGQTWQEIPFRYALGSPDRKPRRVAPHQPRLDWQMWFAALGSYESNPFVVHLAYKILAGSQDVLALLDTDLWPWKDGEKHPSFVRAQLYHYDFSRWNTPWARSLPSALVLDSQGVNSSQPWWSRTHVRQYLPPVSDAVMSGIIQQQGWPYGADAREARLAKARDCGPAHRAGPVTGTWCELVLQTRKLVHRSRMSTGWTFKPRLLTESLSLPDITIDSNFALISLPLIPVAALRTRQHSCFTLLGLCFVCPWASLLIMAPILVVRTFSWCFCRQRPSAGRKVKHE